MPDHCRKSYPRWNDSGPECLMLLIPISKAGSKNADSGNSIELVGGGKKIGVHPISRIGLCQLSRRSVRKQCFAHPFPLSGDPGLSFDSINDYMS
ncbi:hypothetical protein U9M48_010747 [Paspalum notatum var. saurae]|uniref:Uncharacterized protein n=1 Tax=Paspalum notatum var. saurae TaxID=547442 RepID=A0AAQ3SU91_PASNO